MKLAAALRGTLKSLYTQAVLDRKSQAFTNLEGLADYHFSLQPKRQHRPGITAMLRVKNEAEMIEACVSSIATVFDQIVIVDNGSDDETAALVERLIRERGLHHVELYAYPHRIARLGDEHQHTSERSVHSLAYFYNWCLSRCTRQWVFKWDGDMVLPACRVGDFANMLQECVRQPPACWVVPGKTVYFGLDGKVYSVLPEEVNGEDMLFPNLPWLYYRKDRHWETLQGDLFIPSRHLKPWYFWEVKDVRKDEFAHWSEDVDFSQVSKRKAREYHNYRLIKSGEFEPSQVEVIDFTLNTPRRLSGNGDRNENATG